MGSLEIPANMVINDEWLETMGTQACSLEELTVADCTDVTFAGLFELQQLTNLRRMHLYKLPLLGAETAHIIESMPYLTDLHLEGVQGCIVLNEALCASLGCLARLKHLALVGATGLNAQHCAQVAEKLPQLEIMNMSDSDIEVPTYLIAIACDTGVTGQWSYLSTETFETASVYLLERLCNAY